MRITIMSSVVAAVLAGCGTGAPAGGPMTGPPPVLGTPPPPTPPDPADEAPAFVIGTDVDPRTHVWIEAPGPFTSVSAQVVVDHAAARGLNFFALQVDFTNGTWAHGGLQDVDGAGGARVRQANWGGLVDRGGGTDDYTGEDVRADLEKIQNPPPGRHVAPYAWRDGVAYELRVERGAAVTLPPGDYQLIPDQPAVHVDHPRTLWTWRFTARPIGGGEAYVAELFDGADAFAGFTVWNESGYGSTPAAQRTRWSRVRYGRDGEPPTRIPTGWTRD